MRRRRLRRPSTREDKTVESFAAEQKEDAMSSPEFQPDHGSAVSEYLDIEFAPGLNLDIIRPTGDDRLPAIIWLHGGAWRMGDRTWRPDFERFFAGSGFVMVSVDYTLSGTATFPQPLLDVRAAVRWVREHSDDGIHAVISDRLAGLCRCVECQPTHPRRFEDPLGHDLIHTTQVRVYNRKLRCDCTCSV